MLDEMNSRANSKKKKRLDKYIVRIRRITRPESYHAHPSLGEETQARREAHTF